ncbi:hypothetical protein LSTR_LSTR005126 [Laodelphax striatellus]|uniref:RING-type E3 ubiquitin transferase BRCA1 n=1 Tax=Laodelphax striatellus TaxID=195883 RepID=A0A482WQ47_LAOST|nr:hypothetical protein LSTR_LSTR005126 [Laodelphax striatellus]
MATDIFDHIDELSSSISSLQALFDCPICLDMLKDPVRTKCGHIFCKMCIQRAMRKLTEEPCPNCKTMLKRNRHNIFPDETMSIFMGLVIELISTINDELGFDITTYYLKPVSSYEASLSSEEFVNMKSNNVVAQKLPDDSDMLVTSRSPLTETISGINRHNVESLTKKVKKSKDIITALVQSEPQAVEKRPRVENNPKAENKIPVFVETKQQTVEKRRGDENNPKVEDKVPVFVENVPVKKSSSYSKRFNVNSSKPLTSKENLKDSKEIDKNIGVTSSEPPIEKDGEFNFLKPNVTKRIIILKRKHSSSSDDLSKAVTANRRAIIVKGDVETVEENEKKKMKTSIEKEKENKKCRIIEVDNKEFEGKDIEKKIRTSMDEDKTKKLENEEMNKKIMLKGQKVEKKDGRKEMKLKESSDKIKETNKSVPGPSHVNQGYINKIKNSSGSDDKSTSIRKKTPGIKKTALKKTVQSRVTRPLKSVARRTAKFAGNSTFIPKKLNDKTAKFYFVTSLVMEKCGQRPVSLMKRKYAVPTKSSDSAENLLKSSNTTMEVSIQGSNIPARKSYSSVSLQTSPIKSLREDCDNPSKNQPIEDFGKSANVCDAKVNTNNLKLNIIGEATIVQERDITHSTSARERTIGNSSVDCEIDIGNDPAKDESMAQIPMITVSQEEMDIFQLMASSEKEVNDLKEKADELYEIDSDLTQVNPYIKNRNNVCRRKSRPARFADFIAKNREPRRVSARKLVESNSEQLNEPSTSGASKKLIYTENSNTSKLKAEKNSNSSNSITKSGGKKTNSIEKTITEKNSHSNSPFLNSGVKKLIFNENPNTPQRKTVKIGHSSSQFINSVDKKLISTENSITPTRTTDKHVHSSSPFVNSGVKNLLSTDNIVPVKDTTDKMKTPVTEQPRNPQMSCSSKYMDHGGMKNNRNVSKIAEESALNNQVRGSGLSGQFSQMDAVIPSSDDSRFSQLTGQSVGNTQGRQMNTAFFGSSSSESLVTQQMDSEEQVSDAKEAPTVIDGSDDEEIPQTPNKAEKSIILTASRLDCSLSIIPSSLDVSQMANGRTMVVIEEQHKKYSFVYSRLASPLLAKLREFATKINASITNHITDETTHVILAPGSDNKAIITYKFLKGVAMRLWVVNFDWVLRSLENNDVQPEELFLTLDPSGEPGPKRCKILNHLPRPLSKFIIVLMPPYGAINDEQLKELILLCGGSLVEKIEDLPEFEQNNPRILLTDKEIDPKYFENYLENELIIPLHVDWVIDSIGAYRAVSVLPYLHTPLANPEILLYLGLSEDLIHESDEESDSEEH